MNRWKLAALLAASAMSFSAEARYKAGDLYRMCESATDRVTTDGGVFLDSDGAYCLGFMQGVRDGLALNPGEICIPHQAGGVQLIRVYLKWAQDNPAQHHEDAFLGVLIALRQAFPCT